MPFSNFGCGSQYYGKRDFRPDGSFVTTEFFSVLWVALAPIQSLRVQYASTGIEGGGITTRYRAIGQSGLCLKQVISVYAFECALFGFVIGYANAADYLPSWVRLDVLVLGAAFGVALLSLIPFLLRRIARKKAGSA
jgi:hypothetical protein